jgi:hypothetical protein
MPYSERFKPGQQKPMVSISKRGALKVIASPPRK